MRLDTPVLLLVFNRPDTTRQVFEAIRRARPARLFIAADGPRKERPGEAEKCELARSVVDNVDWDCTVSTLLHDENLGCRTAVSSAIDWFFAQVEEGIILEDDCLPSQSFFSFCQELLERYRHDTRVMQISGSNFLEVKIEESYLFSKYGPIWGWATWRRAWNFYDVEMKLWPLIKERRLHCNFCINEDEVLAREEIFNAVYERRVDTWDYQWVFARLINSGLSITPKQNLISNIGFAEEATHTRDSGDRRNNLKRHEIEGELFHPCFLLNDKNYDKKYLETFITHCDNSKKNICDFIVKLFKGEKCHCA